MVPLETNLKQLLALHTQWLRLREGGEHDEPDQYAWTNSELLSAVREIEWALQHFEDSDRAEESADQLKSCEALIARTHEAVAEIKNELEHSNEHGDASHIRSDADEDDDMTSGSSAASQPPPEPFYEPPTAVSSRCSPWAFTRLVFFCFPRQQAHGARYQQIDNS
jgi:hypothetical protein